MAIEITVTNKRYLAHHSFNDNAAIWNAIRQNFRFKR